MPQCVECKKEVPREEMYGISDELRCANCVGKKRVSLTSIPKTRPADYMPVWSVTFVFMAFLVAAAERIPDAERVWFLWNDPDKIWDGELWRLLTTVLPHGGLLHLFFNCYAMILIGVELERAIGPNRYFALVALLAVASSATEFLVSPAPSIGLSGVVYGLFGFLFALRFYKDYARVAVTDSLMKMMFGWYVLCWILTYGAGWRLANFAHTGGFVVGWLVGKATIKRNTELRIAAIVVVVAVMAGMTTYMPWNGQYRAHQDYKAFLKMVKDVAAPKQIVPLSED